jgi:hypothetical protein
MRECAYYIFYINEGLTRPNPYQKKNKQLEFYRFASLSIINVCKQN